ncbi:hypothetical protein [Geodermatophilus sp. DSM 44513]|uniref:hypothetical protein n=1 Tax=Geodermatophilus sp. DSM 44513 TaxID=1528104 RepID=UPI001276793F|nr:hypothetical protein [Geodermatophilus sp. DSM 44513]WNV74365.1 hypothetical protein RTG05_15390 [Geodermatophilus sp. DSM 44513]
MTETGSTPDEELDDPGRDPVGLDVPRNPMSGGFGNATGGTDQDTGQGEPEGSPGIAGQSLMPDSPEESGNTRDGGDGSPGPG